MRTHLWHLREAVPGHGEDALVIFGQVGDAHVGGSLLMNDSVVVDVW